VGSTGEIVKLTSMSVEVTLVKMAQPAGTVSDTLCDKSKF